jgi:hypothetical protein
LGFKYKAAIWPLNLAQNHQVVLAIFVVLGRSDSGISSSLNWTELNGFKVQHLLEPNMIFRFGIRALRVAFKHSTRKLNKWLIFDIHCVPTPCRRTWTHVCRHYLTCVDLQLHAVDHEIDGGSRT